MVFQTIDRDNIRLRTNLQFVGGVGDADVVVPLPGVRVGGGRRQEGFGPVGRHRLPVRFLVLAPGVGKYMIMSH